MSILIHRCTECGHSHMEHDKQVYKGRACSFGWCPCMRVKSAVLEGAEPESIPTFNADTGADDGLIQPGAKYGSPSFADQRACDCSACHEVAARMAGGAA